MSVRVKVFVFVVAFLFTFSAMASASVNRPSILPVSTQLSEKGINAVENLGSCVNKNGRLDVLMLIDASRSLQNTDPQDLRADIFATSVAKLYSLSREAQVRIQVATWASDYSVLEDWTTLNDLEPNDIGFFINELRDGIANAKEGKATDWLDAIQNASEELAIQRNSNPKNCQTIFWFTDGAIQTPIRDSAGLYFDDASVEERRELNRNALGEMCGNDSLTTQIYQNALIPELKSSGVTILGILLKVNPNKNDFELMSYFPVLVEGSGIVESAVLGGEGPVTLNCDEPTGVSAAGGVSIEATSADALNGALDSILCSLRDCINANPLNVDSSVGYFEIEVSTATDDFNLIAPSGEKIIASSVPVAGWASNLSIVPIPSGYFIRITSDERSVGLWKMQKNDGTDLLQPKEWSARVYSGLDIQIDKSILSADAQQRVKGRLIQNKKITDLSAYKDGWQLTGSANSKSETIEVINGEFFWDISTEQNIDSIDLNFELSGLESKTIHAGASPENYRYPNVKTSISLTVFGDSYPTLSPLNPEISLFGDESEKYTFSTRKPKSGGEGEICLENLQNTISGLTVTYEKGCLEPGKDIEITFTGLAAGGSSIYKPIIPVAFKNAGGEIVELEIEPNVLWNPPLNVRNFILSVLFLILLGTAGPLLLLIALNARASRLHLKNLSRAKIPVLVSRSADFISINRLNLDSDTLSADNNFTYNDYERLGSSLDRARSFSTDLETLQGVFPKNPFGNITAKAAVSSEYSIVSNIPIGPTNSQGTIAPATINPNRLLLLMVDKSSLRQLQVQGENFIGKTTGFLISYVNLFMGDPTIIVDRVNQDLQVGDDWLGNLLAIEISEVQDLDLATSTEPNSNSPTKSESSEETWGEQATSDSEGWGAGPGGGADEWNSGTSGSTDDWNSGASGGADEWR